MSQHESAPGSSAPLSAEQTALLSEFGYDAAYVRKTGSTEPGLEQLARMAELARAGALPPYDPASPGNGTAGGGGYGSVEGEDGLRGCLVFWAAAVPGVAVLIVFFIGCAGIFSHMQGRRGDVDFEIGPLWADIAMVVVPCLLLDVVMRWRGRRILRGAAPGRRPGDLQVRPSDLGLRPVPPVLQELVCLPLLTLIPVVMVQSGSSHPINTLFIIVTLALLGASGISMTLAGGPVAAAVLVVAWAPWCWIAVHGNRHGTLATVALFIVTVAIMVVYFRRVMKAMSALHPKAEAGRS